MSKLQDVWEFWASTLKTGNFCIAGGSVRDFLLGNPPKDYDIFFFEDIDKTKLDFLKDKALVEIPWHYAEPFLQGQFLIDGSVHQLMVRTGVTIESLLDTFDWNVSLFAYQYGSFVCKEDISNLGMGKYLKLQYTENPISTLRRGYRFSERFKMRLSFTDIHNLATKIAAIQKKETTNEA